MNKEELNKLCTEVLDAYPTKVNDYKLGKTTLIGLFVGEVMLRSRGVADPKETICTLKNLLNCPMV